MDSFGGRLEQNSVADHSFPRDLIIDDATVLRAVEPTQIRFMHFLAAGGQLSLAKAARSLQD